MRAFFVIVGVLAAMLLTPFAAAQDTITLDASPAPLIDAEINGRPVRLEVDLRFREWLALSSEAATRLQVRRSPIGRIRMGIEGSDAVLVGRVGIPRVVYPDGEDARAPTGIFPTPVTARADGVVGPGALPYDRITIRLRPDQPGARDIAFDLEDRDDWRISAEIGGESLQVRFDPINAATVFNRPASRLLDRTGGIVATGDVVRLPLILGLETMMQPVQTDLTFAGLPLPNAFARTNSGLFGALEEDAIVVEAEPRDPPPPAVIIGTEALAPCSSITVDRRARRLTLRCAG